MRNRVAHRARTLDYLVNFLLACLPLIGFLLFMLIPMALGLGMSFMELHTPMLSDGVFNGFENFARLLWGQDAAMFYRSFLNTLIFWLNVPVSMAIGLALSYLLNQEIAAKRFFRTIFFIPYVCSIVAVTLMFKMMYETNFGIINTMLSSFGVENIEWITDPDMIVWSCMFMQSWRNIGFCIILFQAALANVDTSMYEAAQLDGAGKGTIFFRITFQAISPTTFYLLTVCSIGAFQVLGEVQIMAAKIQNYLGSSYRPVMLFIYDMAFYDPAGYGYGIAAAASWLLAIFILVVTRISFWLSKKWVHYEF